MPAVLSLQRIAALYAHYDGGRGPNWEGWLHDATEAVTWAQGLTAVQFRLEPVQNQLWSLKQLGGAGPSRSLDVAPLLRDQAVIDLLWRVRTGPWPPEPSRRAAALEAIYNKLLERIGALLDGNTPRLRLLRIVHALRPGDLHHGWASKQHSAVRGLVIGRGRRGYVEAHVLVRQRLREALGDEQDLAEQVARSTFCWWLADNAELARAGELGQAQPVVRPPEADSDERLSIWPPQRQHRHLAPPAHLEALRVVLRECLDDQSFAELRVVVYDELGADQAAERPLRRLIRGLRLLGLLDEEQGRFRCSDAGERLLDAGSPETLVEALVERSAGFAALLAALAAAELEPAARRAAVAAYALGDASGLAERLAAWAVVAGLAVVAPSGALRITEPGRFLAGRLPDDLPRPQGSGGAERLEASAASAPYPDFDALWTRYQHDPELATYVFAPEQVRALYASWTFHERKRFVILSGLSGTGKTQLLRHTARLICEHMGLDPAEHVAVVPVLPDWRDPSGLLGYYNALHAEPTFQAQPALRLVLRAAARPELPFFLILDEMNLAPVERYFAPFLSAMETGERLHLHAEEGAVNGVPPAVRWPANLHIGGTVNMDETTHAFSDKVLDRAFTLEFWQVDLAGYFARRGSPPAGEHVLALQKHLVGVRRHIGYRAAGEILDWVDAATAAGESPDQALDQAVLSKILPRLRGVDSAELGDAIEALVSECQERGLSASAARLELMGRRLRDTGVTSFWS